jgi:hypothetical protein
LAGVNVLIVDSLTDFAPIAGEKTVVFLENQCYGELFCKKYLDAFLVIRRQKLRKIFHIFNSSFCSSPVNHIYLHTYVINLDNATFHIYLHMFRGKENVIFIV